MPIPPLMRVPAIPLTPPTSQPSSPGLRARQSSKCRNADPSSTQHEGEASTSFGLPPTHGSIPMGRTSSQTSMGRVQDTLTAIRPLAVSKSSSTSTSSSKTSFPRPSSSVFGLPLYTTPHSSHSSSRRPSTSSSLRPSASSISQLYPFPPSDDETERLRRHHYLIKFALQGDYVAPVRDMLRKGAQVLDVGCGPGFWASEMAHEYPNSHITGIDTVEPGIDRLVNFHFVNANVLLGVPFGDETFDYVFVRHLNFGILEGDWPRLLAELVRVLKPGGWLEVLETDMQLHRPGPHLERFSQKFMEIQRAKGVNPALARLLPSLFLTLPLSPVRKGYLSFPCGKTWAGKLGKLTMSDWQATVNVVARHVLDEENEAEQLLNECDEYKTFINSHIVIGRKKL